MTNEWDRQEERNVRKWRKRETTLTLVCSYISRYFSHSFCNRIPPFFLSPIHLPLFVTGKEGNVRLRHMRKNDDDLLQRFETGCLPIWAEGQYGQRLTRIPRLWDKFWRWKITPKITGCELNLREGTKWTSDDVKPKGGKPKKCCWISSFLFLRVNNVNFHLNLMTVIRKEWSPDHLWPLVIYNGPFFFCSWYILLQFRSSNPGQDMIIAFLRPVSRMNSSSLVCPSFQGHLKPTDRCPGQWSEREASVPRGVGENSREELSQLAEYNSSWFSLSFSFSPLFFLLEEPRVEEKYWVWIDEVWKGKAVFKKGVWNKNNEKWKWDNFHLSLFLFLSISWNHTIEKISSLKEATLIHFTQLLFVATITGKERMRRKKEEQFKEETTRKVADHYLPVWLTLSLSFLQQFFFERNKSIFVKRKKE